MEDKKVIHNVKIYGSDQVLSNIRLILLYPILSNPIRTQF